MATGSILTIEPDFSRQPPHVLLLSDDEAWIHEMRERLAPYPLDIRAATPESGEREALRAWKPEAVIVHADAAFELAEVIAELRREGFTREYPIVVTGARAVDPDWRLEALRAGAWDCLGPAESGEAMALKIRAFLGSTRTAATARQRALVDETSGLYNLQGILRWARELSNTARRYSRPFGCAVFAPVLERTDQSDGSEDLSRKIALHLTRLGRGSDIVGRLSASEYIVLAPDADPVGIIEMAQRFVRESADETTSSIRLRAGCSAVSNLAMEVVEPAEMIAYATLALGRARTPGSNVVEFFVGGNRSSAN
jgi:PleD family two-component response regulator